MNLLFRTESEKDSNWYDCLIPECIKGACCKCEVPEFAKRLQTLNKEVSTKAKDIKWEKSARNEKANKWNKDSKGNFKYTYQQTFKNIWHKENGYRGNRVTLFGIIVLLLLKGSKFLAFDVVFPAIDVITDCLATATHFEEGLLLLPYFYYNSSPFQMAT